MRSTKIKAANICLKWRLFAGNGAEICGLGGAWLVVLDFKIFGEFVDILEDFTISYY